MTRSYGTIAQEIAALVEKLEGVELQAQSIRSDISKLMQERQTIEAGLSLTISRNGSQPRVRMSREESKAVRDYWKAHAASLKVPFQESGPLPAKVRASYSQSRAAK